MEILQLTKENLTSLVNLVLELWSECSFEEEFDHYKDIPGSDNQICFLVKQQDIYIGFIHLTIRTDYVEGVTTLPVVYVEALYVKPDFQRLGIGNQLLTAGEIWARQKGCKQVASDTELSNKDAIRFHQQNGFKEVNRIVNFVKEIEQ